MGNSSSKSAPVKINLTDVLGTPNLRAAVISVPSTAAVASADEAPPPFYRLVPNVLKIVVSFVGLKYHKDLERTSWALMLALWDRPGRLTTRNIASVVAMATLLAPYGLDSPAEIVFRAGAFPTAAATSVAAPKTMASQPLLQNFFGLPLSLVLDNCVPDLTALRSLLHLSTVTSLTVRGNTSVDTLTGLLQNLPKLQTLNLENNGIGEGGAKAIAAVLKDVPQLQSLNLENNDIGEAGAKAIAAVLKDVILAVLSVI